MKFNLKSRIKKMYELLISGNLQKWDKKYVEDVLGSDVIANLEGNDKITKSQYEEIRQTVNKQQAEKLEYDGVVFCNDNYFYEDWTDVQFNDMINAQLRERLIDDTLDIDETVINMLRGATTREYTNKDGQKVQVKGTPLQRRQEDLKKLVKEYIKEGYNPYPLMRRMAKQYKADEQKLKENPQDIELQENGKVSQAQNLDSQRILQQLETYSPYKPIFNIAEKLGSLICQQKEKMKQENYDNMEELEEEIDKTKEMLRNRLKKSDFDLEELMDIIASKQNYIKESEDGFDYRSLNYDMYVGLQAAKNIIGFELKRQEKLGVEQ